MLYFSKTKLIIIYSVIFFLVLCTSTNFFDDEENFFLSKKINLGLDLQGGSYLLLEVDTKPLINQRLQQKVIKLRDFLKKNSIKYQKLNLKDDEKIFCCGGGLHNTFLIKQIERELEKKFPEKFIPRYSMVSFHRIPYAEVYARGQKQAAIVKELMEDLDREQDLNMEYATELIEKHKV